VATITLKTLPGEYKGHKVHGTIHKGKGYRIVREEEGFVVDHCSVPGLWEALFQHRNGTAITFTKYQGALKALKGHLT
jgi:hypothetical protein